MIELVLDLAFGTIVRVLLGGMRQRPSASPGYPSPKQPKQLTVSPGAMSRRLALYQAWAGAHSLQRTAQRGAEYAGVHRGRATEMVSGLALDSPHPKSPEILIRVTLPGIEGSTLLEPGSECAPDARSLQAMAALLDHDGVRDVGVTRSFVRLRFEPFVETSAFDEALASFEVALATLSAAEGPPYR